MDVRHVERDELTEKGKAGNIVLLVAQEGGLTSNGGEAARDKQRNVRCREYKRRSNRG